MASDQVMGQGPFDMKYFLSGALAGGICCSITHGGLVPVDVARLLAAGTASAAGRDERLLVLMA